MADEQMGTGLTHAIPGQGRLCDQSRDTFKRQAGMHGQGCGVPAHSLLGSLSLDPVCSISSSRSLLDDKALGRWGAGILNFRWVTSYTTLSTVSPCRSMPPRTTGQGFISSCQGLKTAGSPKLPLYLRSGTSLDTCWADRVSWGLTVRSESGFKSLQFDEDGVWRGGVGGKHFDPGYCALSS